MEKSIERKLIDAIFGKDYMVGLPELEGPFTWECIPSPQDNWVCAQDVMGRWFRRVIDYDLIDNSQ